MRTTLTLDPDLARQLKEISRRMDQSFKEVVNEAIRRGLRDQEKPQKSLPRFVVKAKACGFRAGIDLSKLNQLVDELEIEDFQRELGGVDRR